MLKAVGALSGEELNYAVAVAEGHDPSVSWGRTCYLHRPTKSLVYPQYMEWEDAGQIIEREHIEIRPTITEGGYRKSDSQDAVEARILLPNGAIVFNPHSVISEYGPTPIIAALRCFVASKLGAEVEIPGGLRGDTS